MSLFLKLFSKPVLPLHSAATRWHVPLNWRDKPSVRYSVTFFWEDLPENCFNCGTKTEHEQLEPMYIEGNLQYMKEVCYCPKGCGFTVWIA